MTVQELIRQAGWPTSTIGEEFDIQQGKAVAERWKTGEDRRPFLRTRNVLWDDLDLDDVDTMVFTDGEIARLALQPGDLLTCEGGDIGRTAMWKGDFGECFFQNHLHRLRPRTSRINARYALHWLRTAFSILRLFGGAGNRTTIPNLSAARLRDLPIPIPPVKIQEEVAALLDETAEAARNQHRLAEYIVELRTAVVAELLRRHESQSITLGSVLREARYGTSVRSEYGVAGVPVLRIPNVAKEAVDTTDLKFGVLSDAERSRLRLLAGDLLFVRTNGSKEYVGRCAVFEGEPRDAAFASYLIRIRIEGGTLDPRFVRTYLSSTGRKQILMRATPAADGKFNIDIGILKALEIPLLDIDTQHTIVAAADEVTKRLVVTREKAERLTELYTTLAAGVFTGHVPFTMSNA